MCMDGRESVVVSATPVANAVESPADGGGGMQPQQLMNMSIGGSMEMTMGSGGTLSEMDGKKRARPRNYGQQGSTALQLSSPGFSPSEFTPKRGRGRPPGTGNRQMLAALGEWVAGSAGGNFTPHVVTIAAGEDVATKILSLAQKGPLSICILSANGAISNVTLRQPGSSGGTLTYEGRFEILSLSGSFTVSNSGGVRSKTGGINVSLASPDGRVVGGGVAGLLLAATPIQVVVGSFMPNKEHKRKFNPSDVLASALLPAPAVLTAARPISQANPDEETCTDPPAAPSDQTHGDSDKIAGSIQNAKSVPFQTVAWRGLQPTSDPRPSPDINIRLTGE